MLDLPDSDERVIIDYRTHLKDIIEDSIKVWLEDRPNWDLSEGTIEYDFDELMKR